MPSSRTCGEDTTNSGAMHVRGSPLLRPSTNSSESSEQYMSPEQVCPRPTINQCNRAQIRDAHIFTMHFTTGFLAHLMPCAGWCGSMHQCQRRYQRTATRMTSGGNLNPANADLGGWMGRMSRWYSTATASSIKGQDTSSNAAGRGRAQCNSALPTRIDARPGLPIASAFGELALVA
jgi:hypothetical protein